MSTSATGKVRFLDIVKPDFSCPEALQALQSIYGITGELKPLASERDLNFRVTTPAGEQYLFKISNQAEPLENIDFEICALNHIAATQPDLPVPRILATPEGDLVGTIVCANGVQHKTRLLTYLPGTVLASVPRTEALIFEQGKATAKLALAMQGFYHRAAGNRKLLWDIREIGSLQPIVENLAGGDTRSLIMNIIGHFQRSIKPRLAGLRAQIAHMDMSRFNMVVCDDSPETVAGILDFGDMHYGPLAQDVAIALADVMQPEPDPYTKAQVFLRGYQSVLPLQTQEIGLLFDLVQVYLVAYYLILMHRGETYFVADQAGVLAMIESLQKTGREAVTDMFSRACGHPRPRDIAGGDLAALVKRRKQVMGEPLYVFYDPPLNIVKGKGAWLYDSAGKAYLDMYNNVPLVGHAHPYVTQAVAQQTGRLNTNTRYICDEIIAYAERLTGSLPTGLDNAFFVNSGSEANELAWLMAEAYTGNHGAIIVEDAYHGWTRAVGALSPSGKPGASPAAHVRTIPAPDVYRCQHENGADLLSHYGRLVDAAIESLEKAGLKPALCIFDSAFCSNGILEPLPGFLAMVFDKVRRAGGLCVADEVQSGFGRMGADMWGFKLHKVLPDIVTFGKPMANGYPMGSVVTRPDILAAVSEGGAIFATFGGNNVAAAAAAAVLDVYERENLLRNSALTGEHLKCGIQHLAQKYDLVCDIRGSGLILGVELVLDRKRKTPAAQETDRLLQIMSELGVLLGSDGPLGNVVKIRPPLVFTRKHADIFLQKLDSGLAAL